MYREREGEQEKGREGGCLSERGGQRDSKDVASSFKGYLAHAHRGKTWLRHTLMTGNPHMAHVHKGFAWLHHTLMTGDPEVQPYGFLNNYIQPFCLL